MGSFGERLKREREMRSITLEEIAEATKIGSRSLRALEEEDFDKLPGGIFNKGFVRAYSRYLGIDADQSVADYVAAMAEAQAAGKLSRTEYTSPPVETEEEKPEPILGRLPWGLIIAALVLVLAGFAGQRYYAGHGWPKLRREQPVVVATQPLPAPVLPAATPAPATTTAPAPNQTAPAPPELAAKPVQSAAPESSTSFVLRIRAREVSWVSISADGKHVISEELARDAEKTVHAQREIVLITGNAGGVEVSLNNNTLPSLGETGKKRTVTFGPQGIVGQ